MSNIFAKLRIYAGKYQVTNRRNFTAEEIAEVSLAIVVPSQYGNSVEFNRKSGGKSFIPLSRDSTLSVGDIVDMDKAVILTLEKDGSDSILRVEI